MATKKRALLLFVLATACVSSAAFASIPRSTILDSPAIDRFTSGDGQVADDRASVDNARPLHRALDRALLAPGVAASLPKTRVWGSRVPDPLFRRETGELTRVVRRGYEEARCENAEGIVDYAINDLYLAASSESKTKLLMGFKAAPFIEPATGLVYLRARWYDPATGQWLTPDPMGYEDSSNLYAFAGNDPVNRSDPTGEIAPVLVYLGWAAVNTGVDVATDWAFHEVGDWWRGTDTEFDWHDSLQTNFAVNLATGGIGGKLKKAKWLAEIITNPVARHAAAEGVEYGADVAITGTIDLALHEDRSAAEAYGSAAIGGLVGRTISYGGGKFRDVYVGVRRAMRPHTPWNLGDTTRGEVIEQMLGHNLPGSFPTIDRFDPFSGHATSIKSIDLTLKTPSNPRTFDRLLRGYVDKVAGFPTRTIRRRDVRIRPEDVSARGLDIAIERGAATWTQSLALRRARRYGQQLGVDVRIFGID